jgi:hypothetical protein
MLGPKYFAESTTFEGMAMDVILMADDVSLACDVS